MRIFYINLDRRTDRRTQMEERLANLGLAASRLSAITPDQLSDADRAFSCNPQKFYWMTPEECACTQSHLKALRAFLDSGDSHGLILEDDAVLSPRLPGFLNTFQHAPPPIDIVRLETFLDVQRLAPAADYVVDGVELRRSWTWAAGAAAYIVNRRAAAHVLDSIWPRLDVIDRPLFNPYEPVGRALRVRHCVPGLAIQMDRLQPGKSDSDLQASRLARDSMRQLSPATRLWYHLRKVFQNEVIIGPQRTIRGWLGARKTVVPFADS